MLAIDKWCATSIFCISERDIEFHSWQPSKARGNTAVVHNLAAVHGIGPTKPDILFTRDRNAPLINFLLRLHRRVCGRLIIVLYPNAYRHALLWFSCRHNWPVLKYDAWLKIKDHGCALCLIVEVSPFVCIFVANISRTSFRPFFDNERRTMSSA